MIINFWIHCIVLGEHELYYSVFEKNDFFRLYT